MFSRSSSNTGHTTEALSARISAHLRSSLMRTPSDRQQSILASSRGVDGAVSPLLFTVDPNFNPSVGALERLHSARHGRGRSNDRVALVLDVDSALSEVLATANAMSREELENAVNALRAENRMLLNTVLLDKESLTKLQEGMRETYEAAEKEGESIANHLTRRMDVVRRQKAQLEARLRNEEKMKAEQEQRLVDLRRSCAELAERLRREEQLMRLLPCRMQQMQNQRQNVENILSEQFFSLQELQELVDDLQTHVGGGSDHKLSADLSGTSGESQSPFSSSKTAGNVDPASDPQEMLQYLKQQVSIVEALQQEAHKRAEMYNSRRQELEQRICQATNERCSSRQSLEDVHQELLVTNATVSELASAAEMAMEVEIDRRIHLGSRNTSANNGSSLGFRTPKRNTEASKKGNAESTQGNQQQKQ